jgi:hypothetical protein
VFGHAVFVPHLDIASMRAALRVGYDRSNTVAAAAAAVPESKHLSTALPALASSSSSTNDTASYFYSTPFRARIALDYVIYHHHLHNHQPIVISIIIIMMSVGPCDISTSAFVRPPNGKLTFQHQLSIIRRTASFLSRTAFAAATKHGSPPSLLYYC